MSEPILVVHGVANHDEEVFKAQVRALNDDLGNKWRLIPSFWADLGASGSEFIADTLPKLPSKDTYGDKENIGPELIRSIFPKSSTSGPSKRSGNEQQEIVIKSAMEAAIGKSSPPVRGDQTSQAIGDAVREVWSHTHVLQYILDPKVLEEIGHILGISSTSQLPRSSSHNPTGSGRSFETRGSGGVYSTRGILSDTKYRLKALLNEIDSLMGITVDKVLGQVNYELRRNLGPKNAYFIGDVFAYQRRQAEIHQRIWDTIAEHAPGYGIDQKPINVVAHSLGGVVVFDLAINSERPLWIKALVTFGSQPSLFHVLDPRSELSRYVSDAPVLLPPTIGKWTNLWEPMDFLAFTASPVFNLHSGESPQDILTYSTVSQIVEHKGITHSAYWKSDELLKAIRETLVL